MTAETSWLGRTLELEVGAVAHGGHCVARHDGRVVFVRHALPGERVEAVVTEDTGKAFCRADAVHIIRRAAERVDPPCPLAAPGRCGGCDWQHASLQQQRQLKADVVAEQLRRLGGIERDVVVEELAMPAESHRLAPGLNWRTRMRLAVGPDGRAGLRVHRSHQVVALDEAGGCAIAARGLLDGEVDVVSQRWSPGSELDIALDGAGRTHLRTTEQIRGRRRSDLIAGGTAEEYAAGRSWRFDARGFWQGHPAAADQFADVVADFAQAPAGGTAWDLYAGVGLFAAVLANQVGTTGQVAAVEANRHAVADGRANLADLTQLSWHTGGVVRRLANLPTPSVVVLDPPRKGAGRTVVDEIARRTPERVVYVACDPAALARDVATFAGHGYGLASLRAFDAFPMTHHVECIALLHR